MPRKLLRYREDATDAAAVIIRVVGRGDEARAFIRRINEEEEADTQVYPTEEMPVPEAIRLAESRIDQEAAAGLQPIYVQLENDAEWDPRWGNLQ